MLTKVIYIQTFKACGITGPARICDLPMPTR